MGRLPRANMSQTRAVAVVIPPQLSGGNPFDFLRKISLRFIRHCMSGKMARGAPTPLPPPKGGPVTFYVVTTAGGTTYDELLMGVLLT